MLTVVFCTNSSDSRCVLFVVEIDNSSTRVQPWSKGTTIQNSGRGTGTAELLCPGTLSREGARMETTLRRAWRGATSAAGEVMDGDG